MPNIIDEKIKPVKISCQCHTKYYNTIGNSQGQLAWI